MSNKWDKLAIAEFLYIIGQESMVIHNDLTGKCDGTYGLVKFFTMSNDKELRLVFETEADALIAFDHLPQSVGNPYEFYSDFVVMNDVIMVGFSE